MFIDEEEEEEHERQIQLVEQQKPKFLPPLPPKHTFRFTPVMNKRTRDQYKIQLEKTRQRRQIEDSLTRLHEAELGQVRELERAMLENHTLDSEQLIKTKKKTIVQKTDILLNLEKKSAASTVQKKPKEETEEEEEVEESVADSTAVIVNPYLQIEKQRVSLAVQRNVTNSTTSVLNVTRLTNLLSQQPRKGTSLKKPFISVITRDDSAEVQSTNIMKSGAIASGQPGGSVNTIGGSEEEDSDMITPKKKSTNVSSASSIDSSLSTIKQVDTSLMLPPPRVNPPPQFAPSQSMSLLTSISNLPPMVQSSPQPPQPSMDEEEDEFEEVGVDFEEPNSKKLKL